MAALRAIPRAARVDGVRQACDGFALHEVHDRIAQARQAVRRLWPCCCESLYCLARHNIHNGMLRRLLPFYMFCNNGMLRRLLPFYIFCMVAITRRCMQRISSPHCMLCCVSSESCVVHYHCAFRIACIIAHVVLLHHRSDGATSLVALDA
jgi:hypothetical protein